MNNSKTFKTPILSGIFKVVGGVVAIMGVCSAIIFFLVVALSGNGQPIMGIAAGYFSLIILIVTFLIALPLLGIAQVIEYIGKIAFFSEQICEYVDRDNQTILTDTYEIRKDLEKMAGQLKVISSNQAKYATSKTDPVPAPPPVPSTVNCPHCNDQLMLVNLHKGVNTCPKCKHNFNAE